MISVAYAMATTLVSDAMACQRLVDWLGKSMISVVFVVVTTLLALDAMVFWAPVRFWMFVAFATDLERHVSAALVTLLCILLEHLKTPILHRSMHVVCAMVGIDRVMAAMELQIPLSLMISAVLAPMDPPRRLVSIASVCHLVKLSWMHVATAVDLTKM